MCVPNFVAIHPIYVETLKTKKGVPYGGTRGKFKGISKVIKLHPLGAMDVLFPIS